MEPKSITVRTSRTIQPAPYSPLSVTVECTATLEPGESLESAIPDLYARLKESLDNAINERLIELGANRRD